MSVLAQYIRFYFEQPRFIQKLNSKSSMIFMKDLKDFGVAVIEDFMPDSICASYRNHIDQLIGSYPERVTRRSDERIYGVERVSEILKSYADQPFFQIMGHDYTTHTQLGFLLAARMKFNQGNLGSGEGWHRDSFVYRLKAILYLTDVNENNGPFEYMLGSHKLSSVLKVNRLFRESRTRFSDAEIEKVKEQLQLSSKPFYAKKGTLILADTSGIHRGVPMLEGERYALTHYYFAKRLIGAELDRKFGLI